MTISTVLLTFGEPEWISRVKENAWSARQETELRRSHKVDDGFCYKNTAGGFLR